MKRILILYFFLLLFNGCGYFVTKEEFLVLQRQTFQLDKDFRNTSTFLTTEAGQLKSTTARLDELHDNLRKSFADTNVRIDEIDFSLTKLKGEFENYKLETKESFKNAESFFKMQSEFIQRMNGQIIGISKDLEDLKKDLAVFKNLTSDISYLKEKIKELEKKQEETLKLQAKVEAKPKQQLYDEALDFYNKGDYENAINSFEQFVVIYPQDALTDNALYWIGESYYAQKKFNEALTYFHRIVIDFPQADKVPSALYKVALSLENLGMQKEAEGALKELISRFPNTQEAQEARKRVKKR
ncbi:MAG: tol-pal system protein YbgF [Proteobacteria bacterium]|nr:tol-pal system protein YbgF [Pseudomonadota bacterium]